MALEVWISLQEAKAPEAERFYNRNNDRKIGCLNWNKGLFQKVEVTVIKASDVSAHIFILKIG